MVNAKLELTGTDAGKVGVLKSGEPWRTIFILINRTAARRYLFKSMRGPTLQVLKWISPVRGKTVSAGDIILEFANPLKADPLKYQNMRSNYNIMKKTENSKGYIYLAKPATHTTMVRVEYPDGLDTADAAENRKNLVFRYDGDVAVKGGYVIGMPRNAAGDPVQFWRTQDMIPAGMEQRYNAGKCTGDCFYRRTWYYGGGRKAGRTGHKTGDLVFCSYHGR